MKAEEKAQVLKGLSLAVAMAETHRARAAMYSPSKPDPYAPLRSQHLGDRQRELEAIMAAEKWEALVAFVQQQLAGLEAESGTGLQPVVVCLCGSSRFASENMRVMMAETLAGKIVIPMGLYGHADFPAGARAATNDGNESTAVKQMLDRLHLAKIALADEILVVNVGGYVGSSTQREIEHALKAGKQVRYLEPPEPAPEATGCKPVPLSGPAAPSITFLKHTDPDDPYSGEPRA